MIKNVKTAAAILLLAIMLASFAACGTRVETGNMLENNIARIYQRPDRQSRFVKNGTLIEGSVRGMAYLDIAADACTSLAWVDNIVYFVSEKGIDLLAEGTDTAEISFDGRYAFYLLDNVIWRFSALTRTSEPIAENVASLRQIAVSPNSESVVLSAIYEGEGVNIRNTLIRNGSVSDVLEDVSCIVLAVSDDADTIYYMEPMEGKFCVKTGGETYTVSEKCGAASGFNFTNDLSEVNYTTNDGESRLFRLSDKLDVLLCPGFGFTLKTDIYSMSNISLPVYINDIATFTNGLFLKRTRTEAGTLYDVGVIGGKGDIKWIVEGAEDYKLANGTKRIIWMENGRLFSTSFKGKTKELATDAAAFEVSKDGKNVYFVSKAGTLFSIKGNGKPNKLDTGVDSVAAVGTGCAYIKDRASGENGAGMLFFYENGSASKMLSSAVRFDRRKGQLMVLTDPAEDGSRTLFSVYITLNGTDWELFGENVEP